MINQVDDVAAAGVTLLLAEAEKSVAARDRFALVLSGGSTPLKMYELLTRDHADAPFWTKTHVFWGDERFVPHDHPNSNYGAARKALLEHLPIPDTQIHPWPYHEGEPDKAAYLFAESIWHALGDDPFDLTFLGLGDDAHTASLFPGTGAVFDEGWVTVVRPRGKEVRLSLTANRLSQSRTVAFLVSGEGKRRALQVTLAAREGSNLDQTPARAVHAQDELLWLTDLAEL